MCPCQETASGDIECECREDFCNGAGAWTTACSQPAAQLKGEEEDSSVGVVMIVNVVVLITGVVASQLLI